MNVPTEWQVRLAGQDFTNPFAFNVMATDIVDAYRLGKELFPDHRVLSVTLIGDW